MGETHDGRWILYRVLTLRKTPKQVEKLTGFPVSLPVHQGKFAENVLFLRWLKENDNIPGSYSFDD